MKKIITLFLISLLLITNQLLAEDANLSFFKPLPESAFPEGEQINQDKIKLGKLLYNDTRLSENNTVSCNSCHSLTNFGVDSKATSPGTVGQLGDRNSPTSFNAALHIAQFWDGRAKDVEEQALGPILNPKEMALSSDAEAVKRIKADKEYPKLFALAFPEEKDPITFVNIGKAIGAFERTLVTPSRFDDYLKGDQTALSDAEKAGLNKFVEVGCVACHNGVLLGANAYQKLGLVKPYTKANPNDLGRFAVTKSESDKMVFKVPSLRNVAKTAPYLHDGSLKTLDETVAVMAEYQLGRQLKSEEVQSIVVFLNSLTAK